MTEALAEARAAREQGEIPIGAVIVKDGVIIGRGHNMTLTQKDPTAHAEILAIRQAGKYLGVFNIVQEKKLNHYVEVIEIEDGPLKEACGGIVRDFFRELRAAKKNTKEEESEETK